ncbi:hypothetical protein U9R90_26960 [Streptomyces sp. E11-3]|uniref:hypothetical protein n=1 Tax=Streptomyces sp. E11-3 TaxID=3110112 RepID=UPI00397F2B95
MIIHHGADGITIADVRPYTPDTVRTLRRGNELWDLAYGDDAEDAAHAWQVYREWAHAEHAERQAAEIAEVQRRARLRADSLAAIRRSDQQAARRTLAE